MPVLPHTTASESAWRTPPLAWAFCCVALGVWIAVEGRDALAMFSRAWLLIAALASCVAMLLALPRRRARHKTAWCFGALALAALAASWTTARLYETPAGWIGARLSDEPQILRVEGVILDRPHAATPHGGRLARFGRDAPLTRFTLRAHRAQRADGSWADAAGNLWVRIDADAPSLRAGESVAVTGRATRIERPHNPGERDVSLVARQMGVAGRLTVPTPDLITRLDDAAFRAGPFDHLAAKLSGLRFALRDRASGWIDQVGGGPERRAFVAAVLIGERDDAGQDLRDSFTRLGLAHLLSISGLHLGLFACAMLLLVRALGAPRRLEGWIVAAALLLYMLAVPSRAPILRAGFMSLGLLAGESLGRRHDRLGTLALVAILLLAWRPLDLFAPGYQLSVGAVAALLALAPRVRDRWSRGAVDPDTLTLGQRTRRRMREWFIASLVAWGVTAPIVALHIGLLTPIAPVMTVLMTPLFSLLAGVGGATMLLAWLLPSAGVLLAPVVGLLAAACAVFARCMDAFPFASAAAPPVSLAWTFAATTAIAVAFWRGMRDRRATLALAVVAVWLGASFFRGAQAPPSIVARIDTLSVGDGSCHALRAGGDALLWDCGSTWLAVGERKIPAALRAIGAWRTPTLVISHPDLDHFSGVPDIIERMGVRRALVGEAFLLAAQREPFGPAAATLDALRARGVTVRVVGAGDSVPLGDATLHFIWPPSGYAASVPNNDASLVALLRVPTGAGERVMLFSGDVEPAAMRDLLAARPDLRADAMEAPHHGSARPGAFEFVQRIDPRVVVQSTGPGRLHDERWDETKAGREWWITARDGAVFIEFTREGEVRSGPAPR